jgi:hypothetical protein
MPSSIPVAPGFPYPVHESIWKYRASAGWLRANWDHDRGPIFVATPPEILAPIQSGIQSLPTNSLVPRPVAIDETEVDMGEEFRNGDGG